MTIQEVATRKFHYAYFVLAACCVLTGVPAALALNCAGVFLRPISESLGIGLGSLSLYLTIMFIVITVLLPVGGKIMARYNVRVISTISVLFIAFSMIAMSQFNCVYQFYIAACFIGIGNMFCMWLIGPTLINRWFKERAGLYLGIVLSFSGIGAVFFNPLGGYIIQNYGWREAYIVFGALVAIMGLPVSLFILRDTPCDKGLKPVGDHVKSNEGITVIKPETGVSAAKALKTSSFYCICVFAISVSIVAGINNFLPAFAVSLGNTTTIASTVAAASMLGTLIGKVGLGAINDKSVTIGVFVSVFCGFIGLVIMNFLSGASLAFMYLGAILFGTTIGACMVQSAMLARKIFGNREYPQIFANVMTMTSLGMAFATTVFGFIHDITQGYSAMLLIGMVFTLLALFAGNVSLIKGKHLEHVERESIIPVNAEF